MTNAALKPAVVVGWLGVWVVRTSHEMAVITFAHGSNNLLCMVLAIKKLS